MKNNRVQPDISVLLITYNHEEYIEECLQSIVSQKGDFTYEIIIAEDYSTDRTREKIVEFLSDKDISYKFLFRKKNIGLVPNFYEGLMKCQGKYIAPISGDDYYYGDSILNEKFLFLEKNPDVVLVSSNAIEYNQEFNTAKLLLSDWSEFLIFSREKFLSDNPITGCTVFKNDFSGFPNELYFSGPIEDWPLWFYLAGKGRVLILPKQIGKVYRKHPDSFSRVKWNIVQGFEQRIELYTNWAEFYSLTKSNEFIAGVHKIRIAILKTYLNEKRFFSAIMYCIKHRISFGIVRNFFAEKIFYRLFR